LSANSWQKKSFKLSAVFSGKLRFLLKITTAIKGVEILKKSIVNFATEVISFLNTTKRVKQIQ